MRFYQRKDKLVQIVSAMLVCALLLLSKHVYVRYRFDERTASRMRQVAVELEKLVREISVGERVAHGHAVKALTHVMAALGQHHVETPDVRLEVMRKIGTKKLDQMPLVVCPENYLGIDDYQPSEKRPTMANCSNVPPFSSVLSILINGFDYKTVRQIHVVLHDIYVAYPKLTVHLAVQERILLPMDAKLNVIQHVFGKRPAASDAWNQLVEHATTEYVLVGRRIERFIWHAMLERMVRVVAELGVDAVGGSLRTPDGHWSMGCQHTRLRNYTLTYRDGYHKSTNSCAYCDYIPSPFVSRTLTLRAVTFQMASSETVFHDYFLRLSQEHKLVMSCPDAMFYVLPDVETDSLFREQWIPTIQANSLNHVNLADGRYLRFSCEEAKTSFSRTGGVIVPVCQVESLLKAVIETMDICQKIGLFCHLDGGTTVGAIKFNGILPWERDADISYVTSTTITFWDHRDEFIALGYQLSLKNPEECPKFDTGNGQCLHFNLNVPHWRIELWGATPQLMTDFLRENGVESTKLFIGDRWMNAPTNPALNSRNRYGYELLKHAEHWLDTGFSTSWVPYNPGTYIKCPKPGSQMCLDQYRTDGNMDFLYQ